LARAVLSNEALLAKIGSKGFLPNDVLNKLQSGHGAWGLFDCAVLKLEAKLTDLAWIVFARRFKCLASLRSVREELEKLLPEVVGIWIQGDEEEINEEDLADEEEEVEVEETPGDTLCDELEDDATEADLAEAASYPVSALPAAPTSTRKPDGWGSGSIVTTLMAMAAAALGGRLWCCAAVEGEGSVEGRRIPSSRPSSTSPSPRGLT
jgi:hypothetical protein